MLKLIYDPVDAGAPSQYGNAIDVFRDENRNTLQNFPKAQPGYAPAEPALAAAIDTWLAERGNRPDPVVVMVHGYLYDPSKNNGVSPDSPFQLVYGYPSPTLDAHLSWLPIVGECDQNGRNRAENAVAFAYRSEADIGPTSSAGWNNLYQYAVFDLAPLAARALASVLVYLGSKPINAARTGAQPRHAHVQPGTPPDPSPHAAQPRSRCAARRRRILRRCRRQFRRLSVRCVQRVQPH